MNAQLWNKAEPLNIREPQLCRMVQDAEKAARESGGLVSIVHAPIECGEKDGNPFGYCPAVALGMLFPSIRLPNVRHAARLIGTVRPGQPADWNELGRALLQLWDGVKRGTTAEWMNETRKLLTQ